MSGIQIHCSECGYDTKCTQENVMSLRCETCGQIIPPPDIIKQIENRKSSGCLNESEMKEAGMLIVKLTIVDQLTITNERTGCSIKLPSNTNVGSGMLGRLGEKFSDYYSDIQFKITAKDGHWYITHNQWAKNRTIVDGTVITEEFELKNGSIVSVGNAKGTITKLPIIISF